LGIVVLILALLAGGFYIKMRSELKKMSPLDTKEMVFSSDTIYSINDTFVNMYLVKSMGQFIAIDAGNDQKVIKAELEKLKIDPDKVVAIFLTHTDGDHVAAISLFRNAKLYFSKDEEQLINGKKHRFFLFGNSIPTKVYILLADSTVVKVQNQSVTCISTPGHSPGSMSYLVAGKYMFTGDALSLRFGKVAEFNPFFSSDLGQMRESLHKLAGIKGPRYLFTAHYGMWANYKDAFSGWKK
jgi:glyoxylase-like metal-dependent hydrolase (beta-lactamase superfamily II)